MEAKMIYTNEEALVSDDLINQSDDAINKALPYSRAGMVIYTAGYVLAKQKSLNNKWIAIKLSGSGSSSGSGSAGTSGVGISSVEQTTTSTADGGTNVVTVTLTDGTSTQFTVLNGSKGSTGSTGARGATGAKGADGKTPVKGTDYFTSDDIDDIVDAVYEKIVDGTEVSY